MGQRVVLVSDGYRVDGCGADGELVNRFLAHLGARAFSSATVRAYAYDLLNFLRFLAGRDARLADVVAMDLFDYLDWQQRPARTAGQPVVRLDGAGDPAGALSPPLTASMREPQVRVGLQGSGCIRCHDVASSSVAFDASMLHPAQRQSSSDEGRCAISPSGTLRYSAWLVIRSLPVPRRASTCWRCGS
jgi:hypothetical protein